MIGRRSFVRLAAGVVALAGLRARSSAGEQLPCKQHAAGSSPAGSTTPNYVRWPVDLDQGCWSYDFTVQHYLCKVEWRVFDEVAGEAIPYGLGFICTSAHMADQPDELRRTVLSMNHALDYIRRRHCFPRQMIEEAARVSTSNMRWRRTLDGGYQPYWTRYDSDEPHLIGFAYPPEKG